MPLDAATILNALAENKHILLVLAAAAVAIALPAAVILAKHRAASRPLLDPKEFRPFPLVEKTSISHNTRIFKFALPSPDRPLGLNIGKHVQLRAIINGEPVQRAYTPITSNEDRGFFELLIKVYPSPNGLMSRHLDSLQIGDTIDVRGPTGRFSYALATSPGRKIGMICGGTGITPMWQVIHEVLSDARDLSNVRLVYANVREDDILMRDRLNSLAKSAKKGKFSVFYVLNEPPAGWTGGVGFVSKDHIESNIGLYAPGDLMLLCGPPPMNKAMKAHLAELKYPEECIFTF